MVELGGVGEDRRMLFPRKQHGYWVRGATDRQWRGHFITASDCGQKSEESSKKKNQKEKGLMDMDSSVVIAGGEDIREVMVMEKIQHFS